MKPLVFATQNKHKIIEINNVLDQELHAGEDRKWNILSLADIGCVEEISETSFTIEGNALQKALFVAEKYNYDCFADDTSLEVSALGGEPGVYSARYAGENKDFDDNINKLLKKLTPCKERSARFRTVIALMIDKKQYMFEGIVEGKIIDHKRGSGGFGYDPVFVPDGYETTFAEMSLDEKNKISHRAVATKKLVDFLNRYPEL